MGLVEAAGLALGTTVGQSILANRLHVDLALAVLALVPDGSDLVYFVVSLLPKLDPATREGVQAAYAASLRVMWLVLAGLAALALGCALLTRPLPLHAETEGTWALPERKADDEAALPRPAVGR